MLTSGLATAAAAVGGFVIGMATFAVAHPGNPTAPDVAPSDTRAELSASQVTTTLLAPSSTSTNTPAPTSTIQRAPSPISVVLPTSTSIVAPSSTVVVTTASIPDPRDSSTPTTDSTSTSTTDSSTSTTDSAPTSIADSRLPEPFTTSYSSAGGSINVTWSGTAITLNSVSPFPGFRTEIEERTPDRVRVDFEGDDDARIELRLDDGRLRLDID